MRPGMSMDAQSGAVTQHTVTQQQVTQHTVTQQQVTQHTVTQHAVTQHTVTQQRAVAKSGLSADRRW